MKGWETRSFPEKFCMHHRKMGSAKHKLWRRSFNIGKMDYALGGHPIWEIFRVIYQMTKRPLVLGGLMIMAGYTYAMVQNEERPVSEELVLFRRKEQMRRLTRFCRNLFFRSKVAV